MTKALELTNRDRKALELIEEYQFKTASDASIYLSLDKVGEGSFRTAYRITGTTLLIKFPVVVTHRKNGKVTGEDSKEGKVHTRAEVRKIRRLSQYRSLRSHVPPIYYYNGKDGVVVMRYYNTPLDNKNQSTLGGRARDRLIRKVIKELTGVTLGDSVGDNVKQHRGQLIFVDCGY